jgi:hypothetical protein
MCFFLFLKLILGRGWPQFEGLKLSLCEVEGCRGGPRRVRCDHGYDEADAPARFQSSFRVVASL